jgi:hypothetical protein
MGGSELESVHAAVLLQSDFITISAAENDIIGVSVTQRFQVKVVVKFVGLHLHPIYSDDVVHFWGQTVIVGR